MTVCILFFFAIRATAQEVHINKLNPNLKLEKTEDIKIHEAPESLLNRQKEFQKKVFSSADVQVKTSKLNFEEKEDLLKTLEEQSFKIFAKRYPQFSKLEYTKMKEALYE